jgi:hypothetical protein
LLDLDARKRLKKILPKKNEFNIKHFKVDSDHIIFSVLINFYWILQTKESEKGI